MKKVSLAIIDDHKLIRQMWALLFSHHSDIELTGEAGTLDDGIEMIKNIKPDIVLLDINLVNESGLDAVPLIRKFSPGSRIIAASMHNQPAYAKKMLQLGARGYVTKNSPFEEIIKAIEEVMKGNIYVCEEIKNMLADQHITTNKSQPGIKNLSIREMEIIKLIKTGLVSKEIAVLLKIALRTVEVHRHNIHKKLKLNNTASLINFINNTDLSFL